MPWPILPALALAAGGLLLLGGRMNRPDPAWPGRYFTLAELTRSSKARELGISNAPTSQARANLADLVVRVLDPLRHALGRPIRVTSGYRNEAVNRAIPGTSPTSDHMTGQAVDVSAAGVSPTELLKLADALELPYDQAIVYAPERGGHLHLSYVRGRDPRRQRLYAPAGSSRYVPLPEAVT